MSDLVHGLELDRGELAEAALTTPRAAVGVSSQVVDAAGRALALGSLLPVAIHYQRKARREAEESGGLYVWPNSLWNRPVLFYLVVLVCSFGLTLLMALVGDDNVRVARARIAAAGIPDVDVRQADEGNTGTYRDAIPADVLMFCGIFGNVSDEDVRRTVNNASRLCTHLKRRSCGPVIGEIPIEPIRFGRGSPRPGTRNSLSTHLGLIGSPSGRFGWRLRHSLTDLICVSSRSGRNEGDAGSARPLPPLAVQATYPKPWRTTAARCWTRAHPPGARCFRNRRHGDNGLHYGGPFPHRRERP
jgi:hypothetical protein